MPYQKANPGLRGMATGLRKTGQRVLTDPLLCSVLCLACSIIAPLQRQTTGRGPTSTTTAEQLGSQLLLRCPLLSIVILATMIIMFPRRLVTDGSQQISVPWFLIFIVI